MRTIRVEEKYLNLQDNQTLATIRPRPLGHLLNSSVLVVHWHIAENISRMELLSVSLRDIAVFNIFTNS